MCAAGKGASRAAGPDGNAPAEVAAAALAAASAGGCAGLGFCGRSSRMRMKPAQLDQTKAGSGSGRWQQRRRCRARAAAGLPGAAWGASAPLPSTANSLQSLMYHHRALLACLPGSLGANLGLAGPALAASLSSFDRSKFMPAAATQRPAGPPPPATSNWAALLVCRALGARHKQHNALQMCRRAPCRSASRQSGVDSGSTTQRGGGAPPCVAPLLKRLP